ncbi:hypothetical protein [Natronospira sp.]|uniref:hypothetical protein n=1 Tax=Natronospira sp. TaxID=2024970 RepID=UPI003872F502
MATRDVGAKQLAMYADNPVRYCNLRGQVEGRGSAGANDDDRTVKTDFLRRVLFGLALAGALIALIALHDFIALTDIQVLGVDDLATLGLMVAGLAMLVGGIWWGLKRGGLHRKRELCERFELDPDQHRLIAASIMGNTGRQFRADDLMAVPHAVFLRKGASKSYHVALLLSRPYSGKVHDSDLFRLTLHMGIIRRVMGVRTVTGSIRYAGKLVKVAYSDSLYNSLRNLAAEYRESVKRWWPENRMSLRHRQRVAAGKAVGANTKDWPDEYFM